MSVPRKLFSLFNVVCGGLLVASSLALQAVQRTPPTPDPPRLELTERKAMKVKVYFTDAQVQTMKPETRTVQVTQSTPRVIAQAATDIWARGPYDSALLGAVPRGTPSPKVYLRDPHFLVDLPAAYGELRYGTSGERMLLCTLTRTLLDIRGQDVTFLLAGKNVETLGHMDLGEPFTRQDCTDQ